MFTVTQCQLAESVLGVLEVCINGSGKDRVARDLSTDIKTTATNRYAL